ncbi:hypothetical protein PsYK624_108250 [Phanerochaete sordida]|uniref:Sld7 C-terminal domain-containing protein n=1 Tax=Phanerochaete sordida TaxID=48140 RepID=A0A9P3GJE6_9APHY|nr:hypothetical protein PsYK624_108250 [Phanerochaete sordida]
MTESALVASSSKSSIGSVGSSHRLLYRGALALPDSHLLLDGLSFVADTSSSSEDLFENPLALALESMRGRPSLAFLGTENLKDVWLDASCEINVYIHPYSTLSQVYFDNILCLEPITSSNKRTNVGIRCGLGDGSDPATTDFLIYGQLMPTTEHDAPLPSTSDAPPSTLHILAARILPHPPPPASRAPRPDDPTPRRPPALGSAPKRKASEPDAQRAPPKRSKADEDEQVRRAREVMLHGPRGAAAGLARTKSSRGADFKVPSLPARAGSLDSASFELRDAGTADVGKGKGREAEPPGSSELEKANKTVIKQATIAALSKYGITKAHADFTELYQTTYRGTCFALRSVIRIQAMNMKTVDRLVQDHLRMYLRGNGENHPK